MFERIHKLRENSEAFVKQINVYIAESIELTEPDIIKANQDDLQDSKDLTGTALKPLYSASYARRKGYRKPDGHLSGDMYRGMFLDVNENDNSFSVSSTPSYTKYFTGRYGDVFGVSDRNQKKLSKIAMDNLRGFYYKNVINI